MPSLVILCVHPDKTTLVWSGRKWTEWEHRTYTHLQHAELAVEKMRNGPLLQDLLRQGYEPIITTTRELRVLLRTEHELQQACWLDKAKKRGGQYE